MTEKNSLINKFAGEKKNHSHAKKKILERNFTFFINTSSNCTIDTHDNRKLSTIIQDNVRKNLNGFDRK